MRAFILALVLSGLPARAQERPAPDVRLLAGVDFLLTSDPTTDGGRLDAAELGLTVRADANHLLRGRVDLKLDFRGREGLVGDSTVNQLWRLSALWRVLPGRFDIEVGRFATPGGFWLITDGARLRLKYTPWLEQSVYGGLRSFTTGRRDTWMTDSPMALPLAGTSLAVTHRIVTAQLTFTWARDGIDLPLGLDRPTNRHIIERHIEDEYFLDAQVAVLPTEALSFALGGSLGTRYDVHFDAANPYGATTLAIATLGAVSAWALAEWRVRKNLRLSYSFNFERVRLIQSQLLTLKADGTPVGAASGDFEDHVAHLAWRIWRAIHADASYRLRFRGNTDLEHHAQLGLRADELWRGLGAFGTVAVDVDTLTGKVHDRVLWSAGLSYARTWLDCRAGVQFTDGIGSGLTFSSRTPTSPTGAPSALFPYVLESNQIAFVRVFATFWKMYAGVDFEENIHFGQVRMLAQVGAAL